LKAEAPSRVSLTKKAEAEAEAHLDTVAAAAVQETALLTTN
jgi:hypothetical protein